MYLFNFVSSESMCVSCEAAGSGVLVWVWSEYSFLSFEEILSNTTNVVYSILSTHLHHTTNPTMANWHWGLVALACKSSLSRQAYKQTKKLTENLKISCNFFFLAVFVQLLVARKGKEIARRTVVYWSQNQSDTLLLLSVTRPHLNVLVWWPETTIAKTTLLAWCVVD